MPVKSRTQTKESSSGQETPMAEMAEKARQNFEHSMRSSQKLQQEASQWWSRLFNQSAGLGDWQKQLTTFASMASNVMPLAQRRLEEMADLMEKNSRTSAELMKKAVDALQTPSLVESQSKWMEFYISSLGAMRSNVEALSEINSRMLTSWVGFVRNQTQSSEAQASKASA